MKHLFSPEGDRALSFAVARRLLFAFDFDGTLAPIVAQPALARVPIAVGKRLERLAQLAPVAIISGRKAADVCERLPFAPQYVVGNHGAEQPFAVDETEQSGQPLVTLRKRLLLMAEELEHAGVQVEDKIYSIALHYRLARDRSAAQACLDALAASLDPGLRSFGGKCVVNIVPAGAPDKADALASLLSRVGADSALFVGDDVNDEPVFERGRNRWLTVRIGRDAPNSLASYFLDGCAEVPVMLERILMLLERQRLQPC